MLYALRLAAKSEAERQRHLEVLYITTAAQRLNETQLKEQPLAGSLLAIRPGSTGLAESRYAC